MKLERQNNSESHWHMHEMTSWPRQGGEGGLRTEFWNTPTLRNPPRRSEVERREKKIMQLEAFWQV